MTRARATPAGGAHPAELLRTVGWVAIGVSVPAIIAAVALDPVDVAAAARQDWPPFVLVTGLLALGLVAREDGLFEAAGHLMAGGARGGRSLFVGAAVLVSVVTAVLNLDTAVAFLTPVLVAAARRRGTGVEPFLYLSVFLANGASLVLPGSNLTNLIVLGDVHQSGSAFASVMALPWVASIAAVTVVVWAAWRRALGTAGPRAHEPVEWRVGAGALGVALVVAAMLVLSPAWEAVATICVAAAAIGWSGARGRVRAGELTRTVNAPVLGGLFGVAVCLGTLGRVWSWPSHLLAHASSAATAAAGAVTSVLVNNLPAASLLGARPLAHPHALLVGLDLGPNLAVTGALSAILWLQVSRTLDVRPSVGRYSAVGAAVTVTSIVLAMAALSAVR